MQRRMRKESYSQIGKNTSFCALVEKKKKMPVSYPYPPPFSGILKVYIFFPYYFSHNFFIEIYI